MLFTKPIYRPSELAELLGVCETTLWSWRKKGTIPEPIKLGPRFIGWKAEDLNSWIASR